MSCRAFLLLGLLVLSSSVQATDYLARVDEAKALAKAGDLIRAESLCQGVLDARPGAPAEPKARLVLGYLRIKGKAPASDVISQFLTVAERFPDSPEASEALLRTGYLRDKAGESATEWQRLVEAYPKAEEAAEALHCLGHVALRQNDPELAVKRFAESAAHGAATQEMVQDSLVEAGFSYISAYWKTSDRKFLSQAITHFTSLNGRSLDPAFALMARMGLGEAYLARGFGEEAAEQYQAVLDLQPQDPFVRGMATFELACALYRMQDFGRAEQLFTQFLDAQPGASLAEKDNGWRAARPGYATLVTSSPPKAEALCGLDLVPAAAYWRAAALFELGHYGEAQQVVDGVLRTCPRLGCSVERNLRGLRRMCADVLGEGR